MPPGYRQRSFSGEIPPIPNQKVASAPPRTPPKSSTLRSKSPANRLSCAFQALKCSSRALEDNPLPIRISDTGGFPLPQERSDSEFDSRRRAHSFSMETPLLRPSTLSEGNRRRSTGSWASYESDTTASALLELSGAFDDHHAPFEDGEEDETACTTTPNSPLTPSHQYSRRAVDPPETPNTSNRDPSRPSMEPIVVSARSTPDKAFDELCQREFNTTPKMLLQKGSLGDALTPLVSPEKSDSSGPDQAVREDKLLRQQLEIPSMDGHGHTVAESDEQEQAETSMDISMTSNASSVSELLGERLTTESKLAADKGHFRGTTSLSTTRVAGQGVTSSATKTQQRPMVLEEANTEMLPGDSSCTSVSSFMDISFEKEDETATNRPVVTKPPFFWRSHPSVTVYSYEHNRGPQILQSTTGQKESHFFSTYTSFPSSNRRSSAGLDQRNLHDMPVDLLGTRKAITSSHNPAAILHTFASYASNKLPSLFPRSNK